MFLIRLILISFFMPIVTYGADFSVETDTHWYLTSTTSNILTAIDKKTGSEKKLALNYLHEKGCSELIVCDTKGYCYTSGNQCLNVIDLETLTIINYWIQSSILYKATYGHLHFMAFDKHLRILDLKTNTYKNNINRSVTCFAFQNEYAYILDYHAKSIIPLNLNTFCEETPLSHGSYRATDLKIFGDFAFVFYGRSNTSVDIYSLSLKKLIHTISLGHFTKSMHIHDGYGYIYVSGEQDTTSGLISGLIPEEKIPPSLVKINLGTLDITRYIFNDFASHFIPLGSKALMADNVTGHYCFYDLPTGEMLNSGCINHALLSIKIGYGFAYILTDNYAIRCIDLNTFNHVETIYPPSNAKGFCMTLTALYSEGKKIRDIPFFACKVPLKQLIAQTLLLPCGLVALTATLPSRYQSALYDDAAQKANFNILIYYISFENKPEINAHLLKCIEEGNPYVFALMHVAFTHGLWGAWKSNDIAAFFKEGADTEFTHNLTSIIREYNDPKIL